MKAWSKHMLGWIYAASIHAASRLLLPGDRSAWIKEWTSELWYVRKACMGKGLAGQFSVIAFCRGAFSDAWVLRNGSRESVISRVPYAHSARHCLYLLSVVASASALVTTSLPNARRALKASIHSDPAALVMISRAGFSETEVPSITVGAYREWRTQPHRLFDDFALYQMTTLPLSNGKKLSVADVSSNLLPLLGLTEAPPRSRSGGCEQCPSLLVSQSAWKKYFRQGQGSLGSTIVISGRKISIRGVLPDLAWMGPGHVDAWIIETDESVSALDPASPAFVVGRLTGAAASRPPGEAWHMSVPTRDASRATELVNIDGYDCLLLGAANHRPLTLFLFGGMLALLALPATTPLSLGEYPRSKNHRAINLLLRRWGFLSIKLALLLPTVFFVPFSLTHLFYAGEPVHAQYLQILSTFGLGLFALRWSLRDQRSRCPVCLCQLTNPAHVGEISRNFLAWNGMELICVDGHGLLHVPEMATCWFPTQRWTNLDASWSALFVSST